nr:MAG TPA: hypothetical protein [Bacteriophage sp.]
MRRDKKQTDLTRKNARWKKTATTFTARNAAWQSTGKTLRRLKNECCSE